MCSYGCHWDVFIFARIGFDGFNCLRVSALGMGREGRGDRLISMVLVGCFDLLWLEYWCDFVERLLAMDGGCWRFCGGAIRCCGKFLEKENVIGQMALNKVLIKLPLLLVAMAYGWGRRLRTIFGGGWFWGAAFDLGGSK